MHSFDSVCFRVHWHFTLCSSSVFPSLVYECGHGNWDAMKCSIIAFDLLGASLKFLRDRAQCIKSALLLWSANPTLQVPLGLPGVRCWPLVLCSSVLLQLMRIVEALHVAASIPSCCFPLLSF